MTDTMQRVVLASRPQGAPTPDNFRLEEVPMPAPGEDEILIRTIWLSLDPYMRGRMDDAKSYSAAVGIDEPMEGGTVGEVIASNSPKFAPAILSRAVLAGSHMPPSRPGERANWIHPWRRSPRRSAFWACRGSPPMWV